jgi:D-threo-aldose 1-dehydrogenase
MSDPMIVPTERRRLGRTALTVSRLAVGGGSSFVRSEGAELLDACWDAGLRYFDTAPLYGGGESERRFGASLARRPRDEYVLSTKVGRNGPTAFDYSAAGVTGSLQRSLERLGLARIDIVYMHDVDPDLHGDAFEQRFDEAMTQAYPALANLRDAGTIGAIGVGLKDWDVALRLAQAGRLDCIMLAGGYTLLQHGGLRELLPWCEANGVSVIVAAPYNTGILATGAIEGARYYYQPAPQAIVERTRELEEVCARHGVQLAAAALQFPLHHPAVISVAVGHERASEVVQNLALLELPIPAAVWSELKDRALIPREAPTP